MSKDVHNLWRLISTKLFFSTSCHSQCDRKVTNISLTTLLWGLIKKNLKEWDLKYTHVEFTYHCFASYTRKHHSFEVVYGMNSLTHSDIIPLSCDFKANYETTKRVKTVKLHENVRAEILKENEKYKKKAKKNRKSKSFFLCCSKRLEFYKYFFLIVIGSSRNISSRI